MGLCVLQGGGYGGHETCGSFLKRVIPKINKVNPYNKLFSISGSGDPDYFFIDIVNKDLDYFGTIRIKLDVIESDNKLTFKTSVGRIEKKFTDKNLRNKIISFFKNKIWKITFNNKIDKFNISKNHMIGIVVGQELWNELQDLLKE